MSVRETINRNPAVVVPVVVAAAAITVAAAAWRLRPARDQLSDKAFFTVDDGKTYFTDDSKLAPPFDHGGKEAALCYVYRCGKKEFVGYLVKYSLKGKKEIEESYAAGRAFPALSPSEVLVKKPGDAQWIDQDNDKTRDIVQVKCPDDPSASIEAVNP